MRALAASCAPAMLPQRCMVAESSACCVQGATYRAAYHMDLCYQVEGQPAQRLNKRLGYLPIMVKSRQCYLRHLNR